MKYTSEIYARALTGAIDNAPERDKNAALKRFLGIIRKNGDWSALRKIVNALRKLLVARAGGRMVKLELARESGAALSKFSKIFSEKDNIEVEINPRLVAGVRITINGEKELDNTLQRKLNKLFA